jgi:hypothetical protein
MIDWTNAEEFKDLPLLPEDFTWPELAQVIGEGKQIGPLFHYSGFLPYTMQTVQKYPNCPLRNIYKTYPPASWPHAFSCAHGCQNIYNELGRLAKCKNVVYIADFFIENPSDDFSKWVQNQKDVLFLEKKQYNANHYQFVLNDDAAQHFTLLPSKHKAKTTVPTKKPKASFRAYSSKFSHEIKLFSTYPYVAKKMGNSFESCLEFMHVISKLSLVLGNFHEFGKKTTCIKVMF